MLNRFNIGISVALWLCLFGFTARAAEYPDAATCLQQQFLSKPVDGKRCLSPNETATCNAAMAYRSRLCALKAALAIVKLEDLADVLDTVLTVYDEWKTWNDQTTGTALSGAASVGSLVTSGNFKCLSNAFETAGSTIKTFKSITAAQDTKSIVASIEAVKDFGLTAYLLYDTIKDCGVAGHGGAAGKITTVVDCSVTLAGSLAYLAKDVWCLQGEVDDLIKSIEHTGAKMKEMVKPVKEGADCTSAVTQETINYAHATFDVLAKTNHDLFQGPVELCSPPCNAIADDFDHVGIPLSRAIADCHRQGQHLDDHFVTHLRNVCHQHCISSSNMWWINDGTAKRVASAPAKIEVPVENTKTYVPKTEMPKDAGTFNIWCKFGGNGSWKIIKSVWGVSRDKISFSYRVKSEGVGFEDDAPEYGWSAEDLGKDEFEAMRDVIVAKRAISSDTLIYYLHRAADFTVENKWKASECKRYR